MTMTRSGTDAQGLLVLSFLAFKGVLILWMLPHGGWE